MNTKPESEQDRRQSSVKLRWIAVLLPLLPFYLGLMSPCPSLEQQQSSFAHPGSCKAGSAGHLGSGNPPGGHRVGLLCQSSSPGAQSTAQCPSSPFPRHSGGVRMSLAVWLSGCPLHGEPRWHWGHDTIPGARGVCPERLGGSPILSQP